MKKSLAFAGLVLACILWAGFALADTTKEMEVNVPYEFYLEDQLLPAGTYLFEVGIIDSTASSVTVRSADGNGIRLLITLPGLEQNITLNHLRFNQYGDKHFLSSVSIQGQKATVKMLKMEKEIRSQRKQETQTISVAQN